MNLIKKIGTIAVATIAAVVMTAVSVQPASANVYYNPYNGLWYGNVCQTSIGWQFVPYQLVGSTCYSPMWGSFGYISNA